MHENDDPQPEPEPHPERMPRGLIRRVAMAFHQIVNRRFGWTTFWLLVLWVPACTLLPLQSILDNALLLDSYMQLLLVTQLNTMALVFGVAVMRVMNTRFEPVGFLKWFQQVFGDGYSRWTYRQFALVVVAACVTPATLVIGYSSEFYGVPIEEVTNGAVAIHLLYATLAIAAGVLLGWIFLWLLGGLKSYLFGSQQGVENYLPFEDIQQAGHWSSHLQWLQQMLAKIEVEGIDVQLAVYTLLLALVQLLITHAFPDASLRLTSTPAVVILLLWIVGLMLSGAAFWLDKFRFPVVVALIGLMVLTRNVSFLSKESTFETVQMEPSVSTDSSVGLAASLTRRVQMVLLAEKRALEQKEDRQPAVIQAATELNEIAWTAVKQRIMQAPANPQRGKTLVVVTCPGGGIHAAAWSTRVLETISSEYPGFKDSIGLISGVSGGSVGALYFVATAYGEALGANAKDDNHTKTAFQLATESSLEPIAFGMMTDDLYGAFIPRLSLIDRGQRLENSLRFRLNSKLQNQTLSQWGEVAFQGKMPIVVFNSTDAVSGRRVLFDTLPTPIRSSNIGLTSRPFNYRELLQAAADKPQVTADYDVRPATAVRTSASFPYVSPFVRPAHANAAGSNVAIGDGGYVDNEGIVTAVDWIQFIMPRLAQLPSQHRPSTVLLLRIAPAINTDSLQNVQSSFLVRNLRWLTGPFETLASVRSASQSERGNLEADLAALLAPDVLQTAAVSPVAADANPLAAAHSEHSDFDFKQAGLNRSGRKFSPAREKAAQARYERSGKKGDDPEIIAQSTPPSLEALPLPATTLSPADLFPTAIATSVVVLDVPFEVNREVAVPLNWKLSKEQRSWYGEAWQWNISVDQDLHKKLAELFGTR